MRIGPQTGAGDGKRDYNKMRTVGKLSSGASLRAEKVYARKQAKKAARAAARAERRRNK